MDNSSEDHILQLLLCEQTAKIHWSYLFHLSLKTNKKRYTQPHLCSAVFSDSIQQRPRRMKLMPATNEQIPAVSLTVICHLSFDKRRKFLYFLFYWGKPWRLENTDLPVLYCHQLGTTTGKKGIHNESIILPGRVQHLEKTSESQV